MYNSLIKKNRGLRRCFLKKVLRNQLKGCLAEQSITEQSRTEQNRTEQNTIIIQKSVNSHSILPHTERERILFYYTNFIRRGNSFLLHHRHHHHHKKKKRRRRRRRRRAWVVCADNEPGGHAQIWSRWICLRQIARESKGMYPHISIFTQRVIEKERDCDRL